MNFLNLGNYKRKSKKMRKIQKRTLECHRSDQSQEFIKEKMHKIIYYNLYKRAAGEKVGRRSSDALRVISSGWNDSECF